MPKAFLLKKKINVGLLPRSTSPKLFSPSSSSGIGSPSGSSQISTSTDASQSPTNDENENRFQLNLSPKYLFNRNETQGLDLSIKNLLKESNVSNNNNSNNSHNNNDNCNKSSQESKFVSRYPYPDKFAKIARIMNNYRLAENDKNSTDSTCSTESATKMTQPIVSPNLPASEYNPINYSTTTANNHNFASSLENKTGNHYQRMSPYTINWSEHFSVTKIIASPTSTSQRSDDSGRESAHSVDDLESENGTSTTTTSTSSSSTTNSNNKNRKTFRYYCSDCNKSYSTQSGLTKHKEFLCATHVKKSFSCKHCDKVYVSLGALKMHIRTHTLPCKCKLCGKAFSRPWLLQGHIRTHTGEKPFACQFCNRAFADRSNLRAHLQTHSVVKKYSCKTCSRTFSRMSLLLKHEDNGCNSKAKFKDTIAAPKTPINVHPLVSIAVL